MTDRIVRAISNAGGIRILACSVAGLTQEVCALQNPSITVSIALGRGLAAGALMGALLKSGQRVALKFEGNGPLGKMIIEADSDGAVRASAANPAAEMEPEKGRWNVAGILGKAGFLTVSKDLGFGGQPYIGTVQLRSSEIGDDLAYYLTESEQVPSAVGLGATLNDNGTITVCGGFLVQALPKADDGEIEQVMAGIAALPPLSEILQQGGPEMLMGKLFASVPHTLLETSEPFFRCGCTREKVERALFSLGRKELHDLAVNDNGAHVSCEFCRKIYNFDAQELEQIAESSSPDH